MKSILPAAMVIAVAMLPAQAGQAKEPAARQHVRIIQGDPVKFTSKLTKVVELNFTFGNSHQPGKEVISKGLDRIANSYAVAGKPAFTLKKFTSSSGGGAEGELPAFTLADLLSGEVLVANNISNFNQMPAGAQRTAIETAIKTEGRGYLGFHGSGDGGGGWAFYTNDLHPVDYNSHGSRTPGPVYKHLAMAKHIILENILETGTTLATVPNGVSGSMEVLAQNVKTRQMKNEWYKFGRNLTTDVKYAPLTTPLLKYDPRNLGTALDPAYRYKGGNLYTFLLKAGNGTVSYIPAGHLDDELTAPGTTFDGGTGDYDRYVAQTLFFLAGYKTEICGAAVACDSLPLVSADNQIIGIHTVGVANLDSKRLSFTNHLKEKYVAKVMDVSGRVVDTKAGFGQVTYEFDHGRLKAGVYFLSVKIGSAPAKVQRYAFAPSSR